MSWIDYLPENHRIYKFDVICHNKKIIIHVRMKM